MSARKLIAYFRVSTARQGKSGLGLEAQQAAVQEFADRDGGTVVASYTEVETGKRADRPELAKAIAHAKRAKATLVIAKLDRLARNLHFTSGLMESGVDFIACDCPYANRLTIHILAAVAEDEARRISERTRAALRAAKRRGVKLGSARPGHWDGREHLRRAGIRKGLKAAAEAKREAARAAYADILPLMQELRAAGKSLQQIADELNELGHETRRGRSWNKQQVSLVLQRAESTA